jgi:hypothetical protein
VAMLSMTAAPILVSRWTPILAPYGVGVRISAVFCHGHPQVRFGIPPRQVELADLLVVHQHGTKRTTTTRALLVQAKMALTREHHLSNADPQLQLYSTWPAFEFATGGLKPGLRNLRESGLGSRYALVRAQEAYPEQVDWLINVHGRLVRQPYICPPSDPSPGHWATYCSAVMVGSCTSVVQVTTGRGR